MIARAAPPVLCLAAIVLAACGNPPPPDPGSNSGAGAGSVPSSSSSTSCAALGGISGPLDDRGTQPASGGSLALIAGDSYFSPTCITKVGAGTVTVKITNTGTALHNVTVASQGIDSDIPAGQSVSVKVAVTGSAPLTYVCKYHRASGMQGALVPGG